MNIEKVYIIAPLTIEWSEVMILAGKIQSKPNTIVSYHNRNKPYCQQLLDSADTVVIMLPSNSWKYNINVLPSGSKKELISAITSEKKIYLGYRSSAGMNVYSVEYTNNLIKGCSGTSRNFFEDIKKVSIKETKSLQEVFSTNNTIVSNIVIDRRKLLLLK